MSKKTNTKVTEMNEYVDTVKDDVISQYEFASKIHKSRPDEALEIFLSILKRDSYLKSIPSIHTLIASCYWYKGELDKAFQHYKKSKVFKSSIDASTIYMDYLGIANILLKKGAFKNAIHYLQECQKYAQAYKSIKYVVLSLNALGVVYKNLGEYSMAVDCFYNALKTKDDTVEKEIVSLVLGNIGTVMLMTKDYQKAIQFLNDSLEKMNIEKNILEFSIVYKNLSACYRGLKNYDQALIYIDKSRACHEKLDNHFEVVELNHEEIELLLVEGKFRLVSEKLPNATAQAKEVGNLKTYAFLLFANAKVQLELGNSDDYINALHKAEFAAQQNADIRLEFDIVEELHKAYAQKNGFDKAYQYALKSNTLSKQLLDEDKAKTMAELEEQYESEKKDMAIKELNLERSMLTNINQELELFAGRAAHDMKEPLRMISSFSGLLLKRYGPKIDDTGVEFLEIINDASTRMTYLLNSLLSYARAGREVEADEITDLNDSLILVKRNLQLQLHEANAELIIDKLPTINASSANMQLLFQNLVTNAVKFRQSGVDPIVKIYAYESNAKHIVVVEDNGIGIEQEHQATVFEIFRRLHARDEYEGSGIGLATCKKIVENAGGAIDLKSEYGVGTKMIMSFPITSALELLLEEAVK